MFNISECLRYAAAKTIGERRSVSKRRIIWSLFFVIIGFTLAGPPSAYPQQWTTNGNDVSNTNTGNVGVGTGGTAPVYKLNIAGSEDKSQIRFGLGALDSGGFLFSNNPTHAVYSAGAAWNGGWFAKGISSSSIKMESGTISFSTNTGLTPNSLFTPSARMVIDNAGNVGIGNSFPSFRLDVSGQIRSSSGGFVFPDGTIQTTAAAGGGGGSITGVTAGAGLTGGGTSGSVTLNVGAGTGVSVAADAISVNYGSTPGTAVQGNTAITVTAGNGITGGGALTLGNGGAVTLNVGAGTGVSVAADAISVNYGSTPGTAVQGNTAITVAAGNGMTGGGPLTLGSGGSVTLHNNDRGSDQSIFKNVANATGTVQFNAQSNTDTIRFQGNGGTTVTFDNNFKKVIIDGSTSTPSAANISAGQFGQNTGGGNYTFPGHVTVNGNIAAKYQDVAEWVESSQELPAGTVVVLDSSKTNQVIASTQAYDSRVAGVISLQPGLVLGEPGEGRVLVATTGRVKVKVDASNGPIQIGDLLVTSDTTGMATKSIPVEIGGVRIHRPGTLIGKALEPLAKGAGEILVLLSMQ
ncbi:MAG TPA: hypothetical protein VJT15_21135 [Pyrinomonadaceae bacterium]|nr:hypothetical protein [Pyrinomonadaceae bacterium]